MDIFVGDRLNTQAFDADVRQATHDLSDLLLIAAQSQSVVIESTHFLIAAAKVPGGVTQKSLAQLGLSVEQWETGLADCVSKKPGTPPPAHLTEDSLAESATNILEAAKRWCASVGLTRINETVLLLSALEQVTPAVRELCESADIDLADWRAKLEQLIKPVEAVPVFKNDDKGLLLPDSFTPGARKVLDLLKSEAEALGYKVVDLRHLLLALLEHENGVTQYGIYYQGAVPRKVQQAVMLSLRSKASRTRSQIELGPEHLQSSLRNVLLNAGELAGGDHAERIGEPHLLRAFLATESAARRILEGERINLVNLRNLAENYDPADGEGEEEEDASIADIKTVRERLGKRLVGQDNAIERILPYIQRMRFGFTTPGRPVGVFLFCGQSGSGKTEMAKGLARAVYGSEENLIFLEMGQFNSPESMNIFVGAPPGYIGYGEGKLTNGLRDKPCAVVLFDEVEKAHAKVLDALLRFLDEGRIDDPAGPVRDGSQCIVILTSNVGAEELSQLWSKIKDNPNWRTELRKKLRDEFKNNNFRAEFLNRVDELILFRTLNAYDYAEIADRLLKRDLERLNRERQIEVTADPSVAQQIGAYCAEISEGARAAQRLTQSAVITPVIDFVLRNSCTPPVRLKVRAERSTVDPDCEPTGAVEFA
jgi:ATP-dependent Clp protease ATP-binding subunit ClpC